MNIIEIFSVLSVLSVVLWVLQREHTVLVVFFKICFIQSIFILGDPNSNWYTFINWTILYKGLVYTGNCFFLGFFNYPKYNKPTLLALTKESISKIYKEKHSFKNPQGYENI